MLSITVNEKIFKKWSDRRFWAILLNVQFVCHRSWVCPRLCHGFKKGRINKCNNSTKIYEYVIIIIITQSVVTYSCCSYFMVTVTSSVLSLAVNSPLPSHNECTGGGSATLTAWLLWCCCTGPQTQHVVLPCFTQFYLCTLFHICTNQSFLFFHCN